MKILAIGNSFSVDAMTYLYDIAKAEGIQDIVLGNLYIGGCRLETHYSNAKTNTNAYEYYKNTNGSWMKTDNVAMLDGILDEAWDVITMQQASGSSGIEDTYTPYLEALVDYVKNNMTNKDCRFAWHMTWAYQQNSTHEEFCKYRNNQQTMYEAITSTVSGSDIIKSRFSLLIPSGTAIQNVRGGFYGDTLTRDGYHLNETARYIAGYTWFSALTGKKLDTLALKPDLLNITSDAEIFIARAVNTAIKTPFSVSQI